VGSSRRGGCALQVGRDDEIPDDASLAELQALLEALFGENSY
jgi:hypothetical protein